MLVADRERVVGHALHHLERVASLAAILVDRHGTLSIGVPNFLAESPDGHQTAWQHRIYVQRDRLLTLPGMPDVRVAFAPRYPFWLSGVEGVIPFYTEDAIIYSIPEWPDDPEYHGHDGVRKLTRQWRENFDDFGLDLREVHDGGATVVALFELTGQTKGSALPMRMQVGAVFSDFRDGRVARQRLFSSWRLALEAVGLRE
jgi:ketosteroid isomerase-like protein